MFVPVEEVPNLLLKIFPMRLVFSLVFKMPVVTPVPHMGVPGLNAWL